MKIKLTERDILIYQAREALFEIVDYTLSGTTPKLALEELEHFRKRAERLGESDLYARVVQAEEAQRDAQEEWW